MQITALFILQVINIGIALVFLFLFLYRLNYLSHFSETDKYLNYYPKIRILFAVLYVSLSVALLGYNIAIKEYFGEDQQYLFAGGGGETINSLVLLLQLFILRQELKKQRPYTPSHVVYFFYLVVISIVRFGLTLAAVTKQQAQQVTDLILATCLMVDSCIQLGYWIAKKQTLPEFQGNHYFSFDQFRTQANHRPNLVNRGELSSRLQQKSMEDDFPYVKATVNVENSKFRIILEILASNNILPPNFDSTDIQKFYIQPSSIQGKNVSKLLRSSISVRKSHQNTRGSYHLQIISEHQYNLEQVKQLYILCGRFMIKKEIIFADLSLRQIAKNLQVFLDQVFDHKNHYQPFLLKFFHVDRQLIQIYEQKIKGLEDIYPSDRNSTLSPTKPSHYDKNAIYLSIQIYKQLWIEDHYEFYMKVCVAENNAIMAYPMRRFSEFEDLDIQLKNVLNEKSRLTNHIFHLPPLPKKHLFNLDQEKINHRRVQLQLYLRKVCNDYTLIEIVQVREIVLKFLNLTTKILHLSPVYEQNFYDQVKVIKGNISKALINNDYVTFYEFKLYRQGIQIRAINKRFSDFVALNEDINRWMNNIQIHYKSIVFPEKHLYKSENHRQQKLRHYLQSIINTKQAHQIYTLNVFCNLAGNTQLSDDTFYSAISFIKSKGKDSSVEWANSKGFTAEGREHQMEMEKSPDFSYSMDKKRMSALIDQLGRDDQFE